MNRVTCILLIVLIIIVAAIWPGSASAAQNIYIEPLIVSYINGVVVGQGEEEGHAYWVFHDENGDEWHIRKTQSDDISIGKHGSLKVFIERITDTLLIVTGTYLCAATYGVAHF